MTNGDFVCHVFHISSGRNVISPNLDLSSLRVNSAVITYTVSLGMYFIVL